MDMRSFFCLAIVGLFMLFLLFGTVCFSQDKYPDKEKRQTYTVTYRGNKFEFPIPPRPDTIRITDPETGKEKIMVTPFFPMALKMNGMKIYFEDSIENFFGLHNNNSGFNSDNIREYLLANLTDELKQLPDGQFYFNIFNIVIDSSGSIVYFQFDGIKDHNMWRERATNDPIMVSSKLQQKIISKVKKLLDNAIRRNSCTVQYKHVPCLITRYDPFYEGITIKNHKVIKL